MNIGTSTISLQAQCSVSLRDRHSSLHILQQVVVAHHTAPRLHAQHPLHIRVSYKSIGPVGAAHALRTYVFFLFARPSSISYLLLEVPPLRQTARAYRAHRDSMPSRRSFSSVWRCRNVGKRRGQRCCRGAVRMSNVGVAHKVARAAGAVVPSTCSLAARSHNSRTTGATGLDTSQDGQNHVGNHRENRNSHTHVLDYTHSDQSLTKCERSCILATLMSMRPGL